MRRWFKFYRGRKVKRGNRSRRIRINKFWLDRTFWILFIIGALITAAFYYYSNEVAALELNLTNIIIDITSKNKPLPLPEPSTTTPPTTTITDIAKTDYKQMFLDVINEARDKKEYTVVDLSDEMSKIADRANGTVYEYYRRKPNRLMPYHESYGGSIFIAEGTSQIIKAIAETWVKNPREMHKLTYPFLERIGLSVKAYDECVICVYLYPLKDINPADRRYLRLLPVYYENINTIYPGIGVNPKK